MSKTKFSALFGYFNPWELRFKWLFKSVRRTQNNAGERIKLTICDTAFT